MERYLDMSRESDKDVCDIVKRSCNVVPGLGFHGPEIFGDAFDVYCMRATVQPNKADV
jgi:hypothetical protein